MRECTERLLPVRSGFDGQDRDVVDHAPRGRIDARFLASLISNHLNLDFVRKNRRVDPIKGSHAYGDALCRKKPTEHPVTNILA